MKRIINTQMKATATLALACSSALVFAVTNVQAQPTHNANPWAATTAALPTCKIVITGIPWRIRAAGRSLTGKRYTLAAKGISCSAARAWVTKFTHQQDTAQIKGPVRLHMHVVFGSRLRRQAPLLRRLHARAPQHPLLRVGAEDAAILNRPRHRW